MKFLLANFEFRRTVRGIENGLMLGSKEVPFWWGSKTFDEYWIFVGFE